MLEIFLFDKHISILKFGRLSEMDKKFIGCSAYSVGINHKLIDGDVLQCDFLTHKQIYRFLQLLTKNYDLLIE